MSNKICKECGRDIEEEHLYPCGVDKDNKYTCRVCSYKKDMERTLPELTERIRRFFQRNLDAEGEWGKREYLLTDFIDALSNMKEQDIVAIDYILRVIKDRD